jgi:quinol monooxygenase YgiN
MSSDGVDVVVTLRFKGGFLQKGLEALNKCQVITRAEKGCVFYNVWVDKNTESLEEGERVYYLLEKWTDQESLNVHMGMEHVAELRKALGECCTSTQVSVCKFVQ